jgi:hypothetical protein
MSLGLWGGADSDLTIREGSGGGGARGQCEAAAEAPGPIIEVGAWGCLGAVAVAKHGGRAGGARRQCHVGRRISAGGAYYRG